MVLSSLRSGAPLRWLQGTAALATWNRLKRFRDSLSERDRLILALAALKLSRTTRVDTSRAALRALHEATSDTIPAGRTYLIGMADGPVIGSIISRVGIVERNGRMEILRLNPASAPTQLGPFL